MAKSSRYMQGLLGVIASGRRRKPVYIRQQALVSQLYPIFVQPESVAPVFSFLAGGRIWEPPKFTEQLSPVFNFLAGGKLRESTVIYSHPVEDVLRPSFIWLNGGVLEDYDPFVNYIHPTEDVLNPQFSFSAGGILYDAAVRYTQPPDVTLVPSFIFRSGGSLTG